MFGSVFLFSHLKTAVFLFWSLARFVGFFFWCSTFYGFSSFAKEVVNPQSR